MTDDFETKVIHPVVSPRLCPAKFPDAACNAPENLLSLPSMEATLEIPTVSAAEMLLPGAAEQRVEGSYDDFTAWLQKCDYPIEYENGNIIIMSIASDEHEKIVANLLGAFFMAMRGDRRLGRYGSNRHIYIPALNSAYSPDASVVKGDPKVFTYAAGKDAYTNPWLVAEVISPSSRSRDFGEKLHGYKAIPELQFILYIEQERPFVTIFERIDNTERWRSTDYDALSQVFHMDEFSVAMSDLYENLKF